MIENNNILLITDYEDIAKTIIEKLILLRSNDKITVCNHKNSKKLLEESLFTVIILHEKESQETTIKTISQIKNLKNSLEIILLLDKPNSEFILKAYDTGIYDFFTINSNSYEMLIKTINCFKLINEKETNQRNQNFLTQLGVIDSKTGFYQYKQLKEIFLDLNQNLSIQNGVLTIVTLDEATKTKVSTNRLALTIKNNVRANDIIASARGGKFYLLLPNIDIEGTKSLLNKFQEIIGNDIKIRAGITKVGINSFDTLEKLAQDGLISAIQNDNIAISLNSTDNLTQSWLDDNEQIIKKKDFKLFKTIFNNKLNTVITPVFYRFQKECENKLTNTAVSQYANHIECVFSLKNDNIHSELLIRYNGYAKFVIEIIHSGLDSAENSKIEMALKQMTDKTLINMLRQLRDEYKQTAYRKD